MTRGERWDSIVVGAGIVGAACARALAADGLKVLVLDEGFAGGGVTSAGMGHLVVMDDSPEQLALTAHSLELWHAISHALPAAVEYDPCGTIWIAEDEGQREALRTKERLHASLGIETQMLDAAGLSALEPNLRAGLTGGLRIPGDAVVYPPRAAVAFLDAARADGATLREHCRVEKIGDGGVACGSQVFEADIVVNAAGTRAAQLLPELPIVPRKGHLAITDRYPGFCRHQLVELGYLTSAHEMTAESVAFNVQPRATGQLLIGSSRELVGWDASDNRELMKRMLARACAFMPAIADLMIIRTWTGFRPATPDKLPLIGRWPALDGVWIAAGHEGLGIATSLGTASLLASLVAGRTPPIDPVPFSPARLVAAEALAS